MDNVTATIKFFFLLDGTYDLFLYMAPMWWSFCRCSLVFLFVSLILTPYSNICNFMEMMILIFNSLTHIKDYSNIVTPYFPLFGIVCFILYNFWFSFVYICEQAVVREIKRCIECTMYNLHERAERSKRSNRMYHWVAKINFY